MKKFISVLISVIMIVSSLYVFCTAINGYPEVKGLILEDGALKWEPYTGADAGLSWLGVNGGFVPFENGDHLNSRISEPGEYELELMIANAENDGYLADSLFYCEYDGSKFTVIDKMTETEAEPATEDGEQKNEETKDTTDYGDGVIKDVELEADGTISWGDYPKAEDYWIGIDGGFTPANNGMNLTGVISSAGTYRLDLEAYTENGEKFIAAWSSKVIYDGFVFKLISDGEQSSVMDTTKETTVEINEKTTKEETQAETQAETETQTGSAGTQTDKAVTDTDDMRTDAGTETDGQSAGNENSVTRWIIAGFCVVIAAAGVAAVLYMQKRAKEKK